MFWGQTPQKQNKCLKYLHFRHHVDFMMTYFIITAVFRLLTNKHGLTLGQLV